MKKAVAVRGPYRGIFPAYPPILLQKGMMAYAENFRFRRGGTEIAEGFTLAGSLGVDGEVLGMWNILRKDGTSIVVLATSTKVYVGGIGSWQDISSGSGWGDNGTVTEVSMTHHVESETEKVILVNGIDPGLFWWDCWSTILNNQPIRPTSGEAGLQLDQVRFVDTFKGRIFMTDVTYNYDPLVSEVPNGVGYSGADGPFDFDFNSFAGYNVLADNYGPITGMHKISDYLAIFQPDAITIVQFISGTLQFLWKTAEVGVGCVAGKGIQALPNGNILVFPSRDGVYVFNGAMTKKVSDPVDNLYRDFLVLNESLSEATNVTSILVQAKDEYWLIFDGWRILVWNYVENTWSLFFALDAEGEHLNITSFGYTYTDYDALRYVDAIPPYATIVGTYGSYRGTATTAAPFAIGGGNYYHIDLETAQFASLVWGKIDLERPRTLTRVIFEGAPNGEVTFVAHLFTHGGKKLVASREITITGEDSGGGTPYGQAKVGGRAYWNIVETSKDFQIRCDFRSQPGFEFTGIVLDLVGGDVAAEEETTPLAGETLVADSLF